jgi:hypothetical protein
MKSLKDKKCQGNQVIEGSVTIGDQRMNRHTFSESYPRKFARDMAKVLCRQTFPKERPFGFENCSEGAPTFVNEPALKRRRLMVQAKPKLARSSEVTANTTVKRRTLAGKQTVETVLDAWTKVFDQVDTILPRCGDDPPKSLEPGCYRMLPGSCCWSVLPIESTVFVSPKQHCGSVVACHEVDIGSMTFKDVHQRSRKGAGALASHGAFWDSATFVRPLTIDVYIIIYIYICKGIA